jgi:hypothetical protein
MEKYQAVGLICSGMGVGLGIALLLSNVGWSTLLGIPVWLFSFMGIYFPLLNRSEHRKVAWYYLIAGMFNWLMIIPAVLAFRFKPSIVETENITQ